MAEKDKKYASVRKALQELRSEQSETGVPEQEEPQELKENLAKKQKKAIADENLYESSDATFDSLFLTKGTKTVDDQVPKQLQEDLSQQVSQEIEKAKQEALFKPVAKKEGVKTPIGPTQVLPEVNLRRKRKQNATKEMDADELFESKIAPKANAETVAEEPKPQQAPPAPQESKETKKGNKIWWGIAAGMIFFTFVLALSVGVFSRSAAVTIQVKSSRAFIDDLVPQIDITGMIISFNSNFLLETQIAQEHYFTANKKNLTIQMDSLPKFSGRFRDAFEVLGKPGNFYLKVRITLLGKTNLLQPGLVKAKISFPKKKDSLQVPRQAVLLQRDFAGKLCPVVFRLDRQKENYVSFVTPVILGVYNDEYVEIKEGIKEDDLVATGLTSLKNLNNRSIVTLISD